jgi:photosystem II stability/assembly factor-like uncharacterized protein/predicted esterase
MRHEILAVLFSSIPLVLGCGGSTASGDDTGQAPDAGPVRSLDAGLDAATVPSVDAGIDAAPPPDASNASDAAPDAYVAPCSGQPGTFHNQSITVGGETRYYFLYVPSTYVCSHASPMLVDFHGTCDDTYGPPEECYQLQAAIDEAEKEGFILVRPRSRSSTEGGTTNIYRWDENPGDIPKNVAFTQKLVAYLEEAYTVDPTRLYAMGFSSGTNMASQFMAATQSLFHGFGIVCGGVWDDPGFPKYDASAPRIYVVDGYRDYFYDMLEGLFGQLTTHGYPTSNLFYRETNAGHDLYPWHYPELWNWVDKGTRPAEGTLSSSWTQDTTFPTTDTLLKAAFNPAGDLVVTSATGVFYRRAAATGAWTQMAPTYTGPAPHFVGMCFLPSGRGLAVGYEWTVAQTDDGGQSWSIAPPVPDYSGYFPDSYLMSVACTGTQTIFGGGDWAGALSGDGGHTWQKNLMMYGTSGYWGSTNSMAVGPTGTIVAGGFGQYVGRSTGGSFTFEQSSSPALWWNGAAAATGQNFWLVGDTGSIGHSSDDGVTWGDQSVSGAEDLYAVAFADASTGVAVGVHGYALVTHDGGQTWVATPTGLDGMLADVLIVDAQHALAVGEGGVVATLGL